MRARKCARDQLGSIRSEPWVDPDRAPYVEGNTAWVPVKPGEAFDREIPERAPYRGPGYYMTGDIAVVHGPRPDEEALDELTRFRRPRGVVWIESLDGITRTPRAELLRGTAGEVRHRENGFTYFLDPERVMFSPGNRLEKIRIAGLVRDGRGNERVADMFAGIGYFTIPLAAAGARVHAMEINPVAFSYLERNIAANRLANQVEPALGDSRTLLSGTYDRIVMGHFDAIDMLPDALRHVRAGSVLHIHAIGPAEDRIREIAGGAGFSVSIRVHTVKKYRPHAWHVVHDVTIA